MATSSSGGAAMTVETSQTPSAAIDSDRWPAVAKVPRGPLAAASAAIANRLLRRTATHLPLRLVYSDGTATGAADPRAPSLFIHRPDALARRIGRHGLIGFGESYMAGEWSSKELTRVLTVLAGSVDELVPRSLHWLRPITPTFRPSWPDHSRDQARRNIAVHYDLSNDLFAAFLDETMTYSCAMFTDLLAQPTPAWTELAAAQRRKIDRLLDVAGVQQGSHVLEIGTGWGELCIRAAARGAHIRSVTLSVEQQRLARQRVAAAGFGHRVEIDLCDYRDVDGQYDSVVSVEMIEAVGYRSWPRYFAALEQLVRPGGPVAIQAITMPHHRMLATRHTQTWIQKYIFPGGLLPSTQAIIDITGQHTGLRIVDAASLRPHYAETLRLWRERFMQRRDGLAHLGFDEVFARMWELYLAYSEAGFRSGYLDVYQWTLIREGPREHRRGNQRVGFGCGRGAFGGVCDRPPHRPVQRRRRGMGLGFRRRRRRRRDARPRRPGSPMAATSVGVDLGSAAELAHVPQDSRSGGGSPLRRPAARCHACAGIAQGLRITGPPDVVRLIPAAAFRSHRADAEAVTGCWGRGLSRVAGRYHLRSGGRLATVGIQIRPGQSRGHHGPRPVSLDASPQLLRRCLCLVGVVVDHDQRLGAAGHGGFAAADDLPAGGRQRSPAD